MLTPEKLTNIVNNKVVDIYTKLNQQLTNEIIKKINKTGDITEYTKSQIRVLKKNGGKDIFYKSLKQTQNITNKRKKELENLFEEIEKEQFEDYKEQYDYRNIDYKIDGSTKQTLDAIIKRTNKELSNMTRSIAFSGEKTYIKAVDDLYTKVISGGWSYDKAIKSVLLNLTEQGVTLTSNGRQYSLESAVKMNLFTSIKQTADEISKQIKNDIKADAVWIAPTPYCRPTHRVINGVVMNLKEFERNYEYLTEEPNCYHVINYVVKDAFEAPLDKSEINKINKNADKVYKNRQKQNYLARQVRQKKKEIASIKNSSKEVLKDKKIQLRNAQAKYRIFSKSKGLEVDYSQTWEAGYNGNSSR